MAVLTNFLKLLKPEKNDYVDVDKHISENYDKIDNKMQELNTSNSGKLDKGALPTTIKSGKDLYDMLENNGGINIDTALLYLNDAGTKTAGKVYFDKNKKGLFECIKTTTNTVNSTEFFVDISNKASSDRLANLSEMIDRELRYGNMINLNDISNHSTFSSYMASLVYTRNQDKTLYGRPNKFTDLIGMPKNDADWWFVVLHNNNGFRVLATDYAGNACLLFNWNTTSPTKIKIL